MKATNPNTGAVKSRRNGHAEVGECRCPLCGSKLDEARYIAILGEQRAHAAEIERAVEARFTKQVVAIRREATAAASAAAAERMQKADQEKRAAIQQAKSLKSGFDAELKRRMEAQAGMAAKAADQAVNAATEKHVKENLRLATLVNELTRALEKKTANTLGDEGEVDLLTLLQSEPEFAGDSFEVVKKGVSGADILQSVFVNGIPVGRIAFDAKNHKRWNGSWTGKLHQDAIAAQADHAVLVVSPTAFPSGENHGLLYRDGVVVVSGPRVIAIVRMMRRHTIQSHTLKLGNEQRSEKADQLYLLLTSNRTADLWEQHSKKLRGLIDIERADEKHQDKTRAQRIELVDGLRSMIHDDLLTRIDRIMSGLSEEGS